jgi:hypothetical protein
MNSMGMCFTSQLGQKSFLGLKRKGNKMKQSAVLKKVLKQIKSKEETYICWAIERVTHNEHHPLVVQIRERFYEDGCRSDGAVETWLHKVYGISKTELTQAAMREYRIAWLKNWIRELEEKGE